MKVRRTLPTAATCRTGLAVAEGGHMRVPTTAVCLGQGLNWRKVADQQLAEALNDSEEEKRANAQMLSAVFDMDGMDDLIEQVTTHRVVLRAVT